MNRIVNSLAVIALGCFLTGNIALADDRTAVLETYTGDHEISVYIRGIDTNTDNKSIQIATTKVEQFNLQEISELEIPMKTLVMIDNSVSISETNREKTAQFLQNIISDRINHEEICIATFDESIQVITDYSSDYATLKQAIDSISYEDQETYLTDVLYEVLYEQFVRPSEDIYRRIIIISDGVDNKSLGYTKDELYSLLKEIHVPIYTIGSVGKNNNEELENMFALSRMTAADSFLLDETEDVLSISETLNEDRDIVRLTIMPPENVMDGSKKSIKIVLSDSQTLTVETEMPQVIMVNEESDLATEGVENTNSESPTEEIIVKEETNKQVNYIPYIAIPMALLAVIGFIVFALSRKKKNETIFEEYPPNDKILDDLANDGARAGDKTVNSNVNGERKATKRDTLTVLENEAPLQIVLTDIHLPAKSIQVSIEDWIVIGRKADRCNIVLDYEKTVSGRHCEIIRRDDKFYIRDLQSSNGTFLNGSRVLTETEVVSGNIIKLGRLELRFDVKRV